MASLRQGSDATANLAGSPGAIEPSRDLAHPKHLFPDNSAITMKNFDPLRRGLARTGGRFERKKYEIRSIGVFHIFLLPFPRVKTPRAARAYDSVDAHIRTVWSGPRFLDWNADTIRLAERRPNNFTTRRVRPACAYSRSPQWDR